jgi:hypothetical protein
MVRPCGARGFRRSGDAVLHQCIRPLLGACCAPGHHGYQRACDLVTGQTSTGPFGSPVFACAGKTGTPSRLIPSQTSAGKGCRLRYRLLLVSRCSFVRAWRPFLRPGLQSSIASRAGAVKAGRRAHLTSRTAVARPRLDGSEHGGENHAGRDAVASVLTHAKARSLLRTAQAMRASLLASAMASTLWCNRFFAASIHDLSP